MIKFAPDVVRLSIESSRGGDSSASSTATLTEENKSTLDNGSDELSEIICDGFLPKTNSELFNRRSQQQQPNLTNNGGARPKPALAPKPRVALSPPSKKTPPPPPPKPTVRKLQLQPPSSPAAAVTTDL